MIFLINKKITFNVSEKTLFTEEKTIRLSNPAARLLLVLLESKHQQVSREELLKRIWEDYGMTASGNSLTNNISILRRNLAELGAEGIIETVPKQGVTLRPDDLELNDMAEDFVLTQQSMTQPLLAKNKHWRKILIVSSAVLFSLFLIMALVSVLDNQHEWVYLKSIDKCDIFYPEDIEESVVTRFFEDNDIQKTLHNCSVRGHVYYDDARIGAQSGITDVFYAMCGIDENNHITKCENHVAVKVD